MKEEQTLKRKKGKGFYSSPLFSLRILLVLIIGFTVHPVVGHTDVLCRSQLTELARILHTNAAHKKFDYDGVLGVIENDGKGEARFEAFQRDLEKLLWGLADAQIPAFKKELEKKYGFSSEMVDLLDIGLAHFFEDTRIARMPESEFMEKVRLNFRAYHMSQNPKKQAEYLYLVSSLTQKSAPELAKNLKVTEKQLYQKLSDYGLSIEEAFHEPLSHFTINELKKLFPQESFEHMSLHEAITSLHFKKKMPFNEISEVLKIGPQALEFFTHYTSENNRGVRWDRTLPGLKISEETYLRRMVGKGASTHEIARDLNRIFRTSPDSEDYRSEASVTAKARSLGLLGGNTRLYDEEVYDDEGHLLRRNNQLVKESVIAFLNEHYFMPLSWLSNRLGVTSQTLVRFGMRHSLPFFRTHSQSRPPSNEPTKPTKKGGPNKDAASILSERGVTNIEFERGLKLAQTFSENLKVAGITDRLPKPVGRYSEFMIEGKQDPEKWKMATEAQKAEQSAYVSIGKYLEKPGFIEGVEIPKIRDLLKAELLKKQELVSRLENHLAGKPESEKKEFQRNFKVAQGVNDKLNFAGITDRLPKSVDSSSEFRTEGKRDPEKWKMATDVQRVEMAAYQGIKRQLEKPGFIEGIESPIIRELLQRELSKRQGLSARLEAYLVGKTESEKKEFQRNFKIAQGVNENLAVAGITDRLPMGVVNSSEFRTEGKQDFEKWKMATEAQKAEQSAYQSIRKSLEKPGFIEGIESPMIRELLQRELSKRQGLSARLEAYLVGKPESEKKEFQRNFKIAQGVNENLEVAGITDRLPMGVVNSSEFRTEGKRDPEKWKMATEAQKAEQSAYQSIKRQLEKPGFIEGIENPVIRDLLKAELATRTHS